MARVTYAQAKAKIDGSEEHELAVGLAMLISGQMPDGSSSKGAYAYKAGTAATVHVPAGAVVNSIMALGGASAGSIVINGGDAVPIPAGMAFSESPAVGTLVGAFDIVFTGTAVFFVSWEV